MKYKFLGKPDKIFPNLRTGKVYDLEIAKGDFVGTPNGWKVYPVTITKPILCPYSSWATFKQNWLKVNPIK